MRLFTSGLRKLARRPATYIIFGLLAGILALIIVASATTGGQGGGDGPGGPGGIRSRSSRSRAPTSRS